MSHGWKLTDADVIAITLALRAGERPSKIARRYSVTYQTILRIRSGARAVRPRKPRSNYSTPLLDRYRVDGNGCWIYQGYVNREGYGATSTGPAHRIFYEAHHGPIPERFQVDHLCGIKSCVNPEHLEAVSQYENLRRAGFGGNQARIA